MKRILAMLLSVICVLSFTCVSTYADEKSEDEEKAASIAESYLSAAAKNMWLYESNNLAEHTIQELVDTSGNSLLSDMSTDVNTQKILSSMDNLTFVQEKSKYFREMRQRQDISVTILHWNTPLHLPQLRITLQHCLSLNTFPFTIPAFRTLLANL